MSEWQPIETAPKDQGILLTDGDYIVAVGAWRDGFWYFWEGDAEGMFWPTDCGIDLSVEFNHWIPPYGPTHWMPLPKPPVSASHEGDDS